MNAWYVRLHTCNLIPYLPLSGSGICHIQYNLDIVILKGSLLYSTSQRKTMNKDTLTVPLMVDFNLQLHSLFDRNSNYKTRKSATISENKG